LSVFLRCKFYQVQRIKVKRRCQRVTTATASADVPSKKGLRQQFEDLWVRYQVPQGAYETSQRNNPTAASTSTTFQNATAETDVMFQNREKPLGPNGCDVVTF
jgi:hypothetical protein